VIKKNTGPEFATARHHEETDTEKKDSGKGVEYLNEILNELNDSLKYVTENLGNVSRNEIQVRSRNNGKS
jgi:hypothetical protein